VLLNPIQHISNPSQAGPSVPLPNWNRPEALLQTRIALNHLLDSTEKPTLRMIYPKEGEYQMTIRMIE